MTVALQWAGGAVGLQPLGAMLDGLSLRLPDGRMVEPLHTAPWADEPGVESLPGILRRLRGEWPCVPFGADDPAPLPDRWRAEPGAPHGPPHGFGSNEVWQVWSDGNALRAGITYPADSPVVRLARSVTPCAGGVEITLAVHPRRDCQLPLALHPVFRLPAAPGMARLNPGTHGPVWTHPAQSPDTCLLRPDSNCAGLAQMPGADGGVVDFTHLPLADATESRILLTHAPGVFALDNLAEGFRAVLEWETAAFPHLMLWISNRGRAHGPWNGRHLALGVEPCCAAFDLGTAISARPNPLSKAGAATAVSLTAGQPWTTRYRIGVEPL
ncbi:hypothetical protein GEU84_012775 [Fertoebacter nigrum]|uniref:Aldose 1-epimerase n=1 Tax=Fertoeibacter niger TaxID=2656921 RepID=A0A8X8H1H3_9RHOB|nr:hypothetical protein [Fertoeibacter niger]NUB45265.1 hypothetical protein [Fertoeibacter niger]